MPKTTCNQRLRDGVKSRRNSPLFQGSYKIRDVITDFSVIPAEIDRIIGVRSRKVSPDTLRLCTAQDAYVWIRGGNGARPSLTTWTRCYMKLEAMLCRYATN